MRFPLNMSIEFYDDSDFCPDKGLNALENLDDNVLVYLMWVVLLLSLEQIIHAIILLFMSVPKFTANLYPYTAPTTWAIVWVITTGASIFLVGITWRSSAAILAKGLHVGAEAMFLILLSNELKYHIFSASALSLVIFVFLLIFSLPCKYTVDLASISGIVLDSFAFISHLLLLMSQRNNIELRWIVLGFGFHELYLVTFIILNRIPENFEAMSALRLFGAYSNIVANECFIRCVQHITFVRKSLFVYDDQIRDELVWTNHGLRIAGEPIENKVYAVFGVSQTLFEVECAWLGFFTLLPGLSLKFSKKNGDKFLFNCYLLCLYVCDINIKKLSPISMHPYYISITWNIVRVFYVFVCFILAIILYIY